MTSKRKASDQIKDISFLNEIKNVAIIGPSEERDFFFVKNHQENFKGENIYVVHPSVEHIPGFNDAHIYRSVLEIPTEVDFVFIAIPPKHVLSVIEECAQKGVKLASIFTAEFSDAGSEEGKILERKLLEKANNKVRILGPNGMGLYYPKVGIAWRPHFPKESGNIGFIAQSGGICNISIYMASEIGMRFSKVFSFGNGADLDFVDLLYFLSNDPETDIIISYLEGINIGRGRVLKKVLKQNDKPIIMLKGGKSPRGSQAAKTHTASMTGENTIWDAVFRQFGVISVESLEQLLNTARMIENYGIFNLENLAVFSISGGYGVILVDLIEKYGMNIPPFSPEIQEKLNEKFFTLGTSSKNPLDVSAQVYYSEVMHDIIDIALSDPKIDGLIMDLPSWYFNMDYHLKKDASFEPNMIENLSLGHKHDKPLFPIIQRVNCPEDRRRVVGKLAAKNVPVFGDPLEFIPLLKKINNASKKMNKERVS
ncbi:MAG: CoA-binding protein, partial [Promethearchaeia archaeon]